MDPLQSFKVLKELLDMCSCKTGYGLCAEDATPRLLQWVRREGRGCNAITCMHISPPSICSQEESRPLVRATLASEFPARGVVYTPTVSCVVACKRVDSDAEGFGK